MKSISELYEQLPDGIAQKLKEGLSSMRPRYSSRIICEVFDALDYPKGKLIPLPETLTAGQRALVEILSHYEGVYTPQFAVPGRADTKRRWLGMEPGGVLEEEISFEHEGSTITAPLWRAMVLKGQSSEMHAFDFFWDLKLPMAKRLEAYGEFVLCTYFDGWLMKWRGLEDIGKAGEKWAPEYAEYTLKLFSSNEVRPSKLNDEVKWPLFVSFVNCGIDIKPQWDVFLPIANDRVEITATCLQAVPDERRAGALIAALEMQFPSVILRTGMKLLETFPSTQLTRLILDNSDKDGSYPKRQVISDLKKVASANADVKDVLENYLAGAPIVPNIHLKSVIAPVQVDELSPLQKKQLERAGKLYDGRDLPASERLADADEDDFDGPSFKGFLHICMVSGEGQDYDIFIYKVDSGSIFKSGTTVEAGSIIQGGLQCKDPALKEALQVVLKECYEEIRRIGKHV